MNRFKRRPDRVDKRISELEDRFEEIIQNVAQRSNMLANTKERGEKKKKGKIQRIQLEDQTFVCYRLLSRNNMQRIIREYVTLIKRSSPQF